MQRSCDIIFTKWNTVFLFIERACVKAFIYDEVLKGITKLTLNFEQYRTIFMAEPNCGITNVCFLLGTSKITVCYVIFYIRSIKIVVFGNNL